MPRNQTAEHKKLKEILIRTLVEWFGGFATKEYEVTGKKADVYGVLPGSISVHAEIVWTPGMYYRDEAILAASNASLKIIVLSEKAAQRHSTAYDKATVTHRAKGEKWVPWISGKKLLDSDAEYLKDVKEMLTKLIDEIPVVPLKSKNGISRNSAEGLSVSRQEKPLQKTLYERISLFCNNIGFWASLLKDEEKDFAKPFWAEIEKGLRTAKNQLILVAQLGPSLLSPELKNNLLHLDDEVDQLLREIEVVYSRKPDQILEAKGSKKEWQESTDLTVDNITSLLITIFNLLGQHLDAAALRQWREDWDDVGGNKKRVWRRKEK